MVISASSPTANVAVASDRPMIVRYCICQPYESLLLGVCCQRWQDFSNYSRLAFDAHWIWVPDKVRERIGKGHKTKRTVRISAIFDGTTCLSGHGHVEQQMRLWREKRGAGEDAASEGVAQCRGPSQGLERQFKPYKK